MENVLAALKAANIKARDWAKGGHERVYLDLQSLGLQSSQRRTIERNGGAWVEMDGNEALVQGFDSRSGDAEREVIEALKAGGIEAR